MRCDRRALAVALLLAAAGCDPGVCTRRSDCATGFVCSAAGACVSTAPDGGADADLGDATADAGDATSEDAAIDAPIDAPAIDAPTIDAPTDAAIDAAIDAPIDAPPGGRPPLEPSPGDVN